MHIIENPMDSQKVDMFVMTNSKYFETHQMKHIQEQLKNIDETKWSLLYATQFKDPTTILIVSLLAGAFGIDRFMLGDTGLGIGKLLTCGGFGIWTIVDWFMIMDATREKNFENLQRVLY